MQVNSNGVPQLAGGHAATQQTEARSQALPVSDNLIWKTHTLHTAVTALPHSNGAVRHGSGKQRAADQALQSSAVHQPSAMQNLAAEAPLGKAVNGNVSRLIASRPAPRKQDALASQNMPEQPQHSYHRAKDRPGDEGEKPLSDLLHATSRHSSRDSSKERRHSEDHVKDNPSHRHAASSDRHNRSHRPERYPDRHESLGDRHSREIDKYGSKSSSRHMDKHKQPASSHGDRHRNDAHAREHQKLRPDKGSAISDRQLGRSKEHHQNAHESRLGESKRHRSRSPHIARHYVKR